MLDVEGSNALYNKTNIGRMTATLCFDNIDDDLKGMFKCRGVLLEESKDDDIMAIKQCRCQSEAIGIVLKSETNIDWDWVREETKEMTVAEIEKALGYSVKIVKE